MRNIIIDAEFKRLLPALSKNSYSSLEYSILAHGCRDPLVLWNDILIDGYNRFEICTKHNIEFDTVDMQFDSREEVLIWIITNQVARRNLSPLQLSYFRGLHYNAEKKLKGRNYQNSDIIQMGQNELFKFRRRIYGSAYFCFSDGVNVNSRMCTRRSVSAVSRSGR